MKKIKILLIAFLSALVCQANAQYTFFSPEDAFAIEVSLPNSDLKRLPINRNSIASLAIIGDHIIAGTSANEGLTPFLFVASINEQKVTEMYDLEMIIAGQQSISTGFAKGGENVFYAGTIANKNKANIGGHLLQITVGNSGELNIKDLGIPIPEEGMLALTNNAENNTLFGISYPSGIFFTYNIINGKVKQYDDIVPAEADIRLFGEYQLSPRQYLCSALIEDDNGMVYGSAPMNRLFYFDPKEDKITFCKESLPKVWGRGPMGAIESWAKSSNGKLYGGNAGDGQLFEIDPITKNIKNIGKPIMMNRLRGLTFARDGKLYGIAGGAPGYVHLFCYDKYGGFKDLGNPEFVMKAPGIEQGIKWRGFQLRTITSSEDGKYIVMGEDESLSQLLIFPVSESE